MDVLASIGGFSSVVYIFCNVVVRSIQDFLFYKSIMNDIFTEQINPDEQLVKDSSKTIQDNTSIQ